MGLPKNYRARKGDILILHATVRYDQSRGDSISVKVEGHNWDVTLGRDQIAGVSRVNLDKGDTVIVRGDAEDVGTILAVDGDFAWVGRKTKGANATVHVGELERIETEPEPEPEFGEIDETVAEAARGPADSQVIAIPAEAA